MDTQRIVLRENWKFHLEEPGDYRCGERGGYPRSAASGAWYKGFDDSAWRSVSVPHDWSVELPFSKEYSSGTGYLAGGIGWYRVHFQLPEAYRGKNVRVIFDGVYKNSQVWCNSYYLGRRPYGYSTFSYDISHAAAFGEEENVLCVKVVHTDLADSRWFTGSGITRKVTVVVQEPVHPAEYGVFFSAQSVEPEEEASGSRGRARIVIRHWTETPGSPEGTEAGQHASVETCPGENGKNAAACSAGEGGSRQEPERQAARETCPGQNGKGASAYSAGEGGSRQEPGEQAARETCPGENGKGAVACSAGEAGSRQEQEAGEPSDGGQGGGKSARVHIRTALQGADGQTALILEGQTQPGGECILTGTLKNAMLWSPEHPYLYTMRTWYAVDCAERPDCTPEYYLVDESKVGVRGIVFDPEKGFFLNGAMTKLKGVCVHHDGGVLGAAMEPEVWQRRLALLKECGCNAIRCSHNPHMPELYDLCDAMGFFVMDEAFDEWENAKNKWSTGHNVYPPVHEGYFEEFPQWHRADLQAMVRRDRNHPSVILWSIGNEIDYPNDPYCHSSFASMTGNNDADKPAAERQYDRNKPNAERLVSIAAMLEREVRQEDATRPVTLAAAFPELSARTGLLGGLDVIGYNYKEHLYEADHARFSDKPLLGSENGHGYGAWLAVRDNPYISGQFLWTGIDYLGEARGWPVHGSFAGILTCAGERKPEFYRRKSFWSGEPMIALATRRMSEGPEDWRPMESHWNYEEGEKILVKVYSNLPKVRLFLEASECAGEAGGEETKASDAASSASQEREETQLRQSGSCQDLGALEGYNGDGAYCYQVRYRPGRLCAEGYGKPESGIFLRAGAPKAGESSSAGCSLEATGKEDGCTAVCSLATAGQAAGLECHIWQQPDALTGKSWEEASGEPGYLYQLEIGLKDSPGNPVTWQERMISVEVDGAGALAGLENGNLADVTPYRENSRATFRGRLVAYVRRSGAGEINVRISMNDGGESAWLCCRIPESLREK